MTIRKMVVLSVAALSIVTTSAHAGGFIGDLVNKVAPGVGTALDRANDNCGNCFDHTMAGVANAYVPGSGAALEAGWAVQRSGALNGFHQPIGQPAQPQLGARCYGQFEVSAYGPSMPLGSPCNFPGQYGQVFGQVGQ